MSNSSHHPPRPLVVVALRTQHENLGDWLIINLLVQELAKNVTVLLDIAGVPEDFYRAILRENVEILQDRVRVSSCRSWGFLRWAARQPRLGVLMSPGHFGRIVKPKHQFRWASICFASAVYNLAGVKFLRFGASFDDFGVLARLATRFYCLGNTLVVRDARSAILGFPIAADMATLITRDDPPPATPLQRIVLSIRADRGAPAQRQALFDTWTALGRQLHRTLHLPIDVVYQVGRDEKVCRELAGVLRADGIAGEVVPVNRDNFAAMYAPGVIVASNRLHVSLTALCLGACAFAVIDPAVDGKILGAFETIGVSDRCLPAGPDSAGALLPRIRAWDADGSRIHRSLIAARDHLRSVVQRELARRLK